MSRVAVSSEGINVEVDRSLTEAFRAAVKQHASSDSFEAFEEAALSIARELARESCEQELQQTADELAHRVRIEGVEYRQHEIGSGQYYSLCGKLDVRRHTYRRVGRIKKRRYTNYAGQTRSIVPVELACGLIEGATPALAYSIAHGYAQGPVRAYAESMQAAHRCVPPRATAERIAKRIAGGAKQAVPEIEPCVRQAERVPAGTHAICVGMDRTSVPMLEERPPGKPANSERRARRRPYQRKPPVPFDVNYRMGYVGTVAFIDHNGDSLVARQYAATPEEGGEELAQRMMADVSRALSQEPGLVVTVVQDGAPELWTLVGHALRAIGVHKWRQVIDRYHLNERLADALSMVERNPGIRAQIYARWQKELDAKQLAIDAIADWLMAHAKSVSKCNRKAFEQHCTYVHINSRFLRYARSKRERLPIGSGVTEGACKSLYAARVKRSGQRWCQDGLTGVLTLRAMHQSERLPRFWRHYKARFCATVHAAE